MTFSGTSLVIATPGKSKLVIYNVVATNSNLTCSPFEHFASYPGMQGLHELKWKSLTLNDTLVALYYVCITQSPILSSIRFSAMDLPLQIFPSVAYR